MFLIGTKRPTKPTTTSLPPIPEIAAQVRRVDRLFEQRLNVEPERDDCGLRARCDVKSPDELVALPRRDRDDAITHVASVRSAILASALPAAPKYPDNT